MRNRPPLATPTPARSRAFARSDSGRYTVLVTAATPGATRRLLLVDDDAQLLEHVTEVLGRIEDSEVESFERGAEAVQRAAEVQFALAVLDMDMPELNGVEVARALRDLQPAIAIVFLTGSSHELTEAEVQDVGPRAVMRKPVSAAVLLETVRSILDA